MATALVSAASSTGGMRAVQAVVAAGMVCGTLDGISAWLVSNAKWTIVFQFIASGVLGPDSFKGGTKTVALGIALHYSIAFGATIVFYVASRYLPILVDRALPFGVLYGVCVYLFMNFVVIPLSAIGGGRPFSWKGFFIYLAIHMVVVGPSIALTLRRFLR